MNSFFKSHVYSILLSIVFITFGIYRASEIVEHSNNYQNHMTAHVKVLNFEERLFNAKEWSLLLVEKAFDFVDDSEWNKKEQEAVQILLNAENEYSLAKEKSIEVGVASFVLIALIILIYFKSNLRSQLTIPIFSICLTLLFLGVFTPMLEISASNTDLEIPIAFDLSSISSPIQKGLQLFDDLTGLEIAKSSIPSELKTTIEFKGKMYFYYQSKSIYQLIQLLFKDKNWLVGISILLFSVLIPVTKLLFTLIISFKKNTNKKLLSFFSFIGKWSMADVFVASCFLAFLSFSNMNVGIDTESKILYGLYFFFSYVILSILMSSLIKSSNK